MTWIENGKCQKGAKKEREVKRIKGARGGLISVFSMHSYQAKIDEFEIMFGLV